MIELQSKNRKTMPSPIKREMIALRRIPASAIQDQGIPAERHGFGVAVARRHAAADFWRTREERIFARFSTGEHRHYFEVTFAEDRKVAAPDPAQIKRALQMPVLHWLLAAMDDDFD